MSLTSERLIWVDFAKVLAIFCVVLTHVLSPLFSPDRCFITVEWTVVNFLYALSRICVPVFFVCIGIFFFDSTKKIEQVIFSRVKRILPPFLFWLFVYSLIPFVFDGREMNFREVVNVLLTPGILWFVYELLFIYLVLYLIYYKLIKLDIKNIGLLIIFWAIVSLLKLLIPQYSWGIVSLDLQLVFYIAAKFLMYIGYPLVGLYLAKIDLKNNILFLFSLGGIIIINIFLVLLAGCNFAVLDGNMYRRLCNFTGLPVVIITISIMLFIKCIFSTTISLPAFIQNAIIFISKYTLGIYLSHYIFLRVVNQILNFCGITDSSLFLFISLATFMTFTITLIFVHFALKVPYLSKVIN